MFRLICVLHLLAQFVGCFIFHLILLAVCVQVSINTLAQKEAKGMVLEIMNAKRREYRKFAARYFFDKLLRCMKTQAAYDRQIELQVEAQAGGKQDSGQLLNGLSSESTSQRELNGTNSSNTSSKKSKKSKAQAKTQTTGQAQNSQNSLTRSLAVVEPVDMYDMLVIDNAVEYLVTLVRIFNHENLILLQ